MVFGLNKTLFFLLLYSIQGRKEDVENPDYYVLDGGALLHRVRWLKGMKFNAVSQVYANYIRKNYKGCVTVVFNGYQDEGTKSHEHLRRNSIPQSCNVDIHEENPVPFTQHRFLSNTENKANSINFLSQHLIQSAYLTINCLGDADSTVVKIQVGDMLLLWLMAQISQ